MFVKIHGRVRFFWISEERRKIVNDIISIFIQLSDSIYITKETIVNLALCFFKSFL